MDVPCHFLVRCLLLLALATTVGGISRSFLVPRGIGMAVGQQKAAVCAEMPSLQLRGAADGSPRNWNEGQSKRLRGGEGVKPMSKEEGEAAAVKILKSFGIDEPDVGDDMAWLEQDDPDGTLGVTYDIKRMVDRALIELDKDMRAQGRPDWKRELVGKSAPEVVSTMLRVDEEVLKKGRVDVGDSVEVINEEDVVDEELYKITDDLRNENITDFRDMMVRESRKEEYSEDVRQMISHEVERLDKEIDGEKSELVSQLEFLDKLSDARGLMKAAKEGDAAAVRQHLEDGIDPDTPDVTFANWTALHWAAIGGKTTCIQHLLEGGAVIDARSDTGQTPLHLAATGGWSDAVSMLVSCGADLEARDTLGNTPLHVAAQCDTVKVTSLLIQLGCSRSLHNTQGQTPTDIAGLQARRVLLRAAGVVDPDVEKAYADRDRARRTDVTFSDKDGTEYSGLLLEREFE